jgi:hypothetical protein
LCEVDWARGHTDPQEGHAYLRVDSWEGSEALLQFAQAFGDEFTAIFVRANGRSTEFQATCLELQVGREVRWWV